MASPQDGVVIVGSGLGGYTLARELRKLAPETPVTVMTADGGEVYAKPMLSAAFAQGKTPDTLVQKTAGDFAAEQKLTVITRRRVEAIDRAGHVLTLDDGQRVGYGRLVLALGADPRPYAVPGADTVIIHTVNDMDDYRVWRDGIASGVRVLLVGAGLIGCEFANDLAHAGAVVTVVDPAPWPLGRLLPQELGDEMARALDSVGITLRLGRSLTRIEPGKAILDDGSEIAFDTALSAIGLIPRTALARQAGLSVDKGIVVDRFLRTSDPAIYALGDCAQTEAGPLPFVAPLMAEAKALASTLAGRETPLCLPALPVVVKTPALPMVVCPPPPGTAGHWEVQGEGRDRKAMFTAADGTALGFALSGELVSQRQTLAKSMPALLA